jgi:hypothetical protein
MQQDNCQTLLAEYRPPKWVILKARNNTKGGSITVPLTSCLTGLESAVRQLTLCFYSQNRLIQTGQTGGQSTVIIPPLVFPAERDQLQTHARFQYFVKKGSSFYIW